MAWLFDFGVEGQLQDGYVKITKDTLYKSTEGYGFIHTEKVSCKRRSHELLTGDFCIPFDSTFIVDVPNGNYIVTIISGDELAPTQTSLKTNGEHVVLQQYETVQGQVAREQFALHVKNGQAKFSFGGLAPRVNGLEIRASDQQVTVYLAGDSTVTDASPEGYPFSGWGQMLNYFFKHDVVVANYAIGGRSSKSFIDEGHLNKILEQIKPGDFLFIQFGHNDQKPDVARHTDPDTTYQDYLKAYIEAARSKNAVPVLLTSVHRRYYDQAGHIINTHTNYVDAVKKVAAEEQVLLIDLAAKSKAMFEEVGKEGTKSIFLWGEAGEWINYSNGIKDNTHFQEHGGMRIAKLVVDSINELNITPLTMYIR